MSLDTKPYKYAVCFYFLQVSKTQQKQPSHTTAYRRAKKTRQRVPINRYHLDFITSADTHHIFFKKKMGLKWTNKARACLKYAKAVAYVIATGDALSVSQGEQDMTKVEALCTDAKMTWSGDGRAHVLPDQDSSPR